MHLRRAFFSNINSHCAPSRNVILHLTLRNHYLLMTKVMTIVSFESISILHLHIHLHVSKRHFLPRLNLLLNQLLRKLIHIWNLLFKILTSRNLLRQGSNQQEPHLRTCLNHRSNLQSIHLLLSVLQRSSMIQGLRSIAHLPIILLLSLLVILKKTHRLS